MFRKILKIAGWSILAIAVAVAAFVFYQFRDRADGYSHDLFLKPTEKAMTLKIGFSKMKITPDAADWEKWTDKNKDAEFRLSDGDTFEDRNGDGKFQTFWMAGFDQARAMNGVHDDLWARTMVIDDGERRVSITSVDCIGLGQDQVIQIRKKILAASKVDFAMISSTHTHEAPDVIGLWGETEYQTGVDKKFIQLIENQAVASIEAAVKNLRPAKIWAGANEKDALPLLEDGRKPDVFDAGVYVLHCRDAEVDTCLGNYVLWGNHPEVLWSRNLLLTSDYAHFLRETVEKGVTLNDSIGTVGLGGTCVFGVGSIGGLMTTSRNFKIKSFKTGDTLTGATFEKAEAVGQTVGNIAIQIAQKCRQTEAATTAVPIYLRAKTFESPLENSFYKLAVVLGVVNRGFPNWGMVRSEVAAIRLGDLATFLAVPGEIYPEMVHGGVESPDGQDFQIQAHETPPLRSFFKTKTPFLIGLCNDELGYILPKSQWDALAPFTYGEISEPYGEVNSCGPQTGPNVYKMCREMLEAVQ